MKKILLLGKDGMLGKELVKALQNDFDLSAFGRDDLDITKLEDLEKKFEEIKPDFCVNAAAYTDVDGAETERDEAMAVNRDGVKNLAELCKRFGAKLIHFSTDYVFDGESEYGYSEDAETNPINFYGRTKLEGEKAIQTSGCDFTIVRTSWLFGDGRNFVRTMLELGKNKNEIKVVSDQTGSPTFARDLAAAILQLLQTVIPAQAGIQKKNKGEIFHLTNSGQTTWSDFARKIFELAKMDAKVIPITTADFPTAAKRPKNSALLNTKLPKLRSWEDALEEYITFLKIRE